MKEQGGLIPHPAMASGESGVQCKECRDFFFVGKREDEENGFVISVFVARLEDIDKVSVQPLLGSLQEHAIYSVITGNWDDHSSVIKMNRTNHYMNLTAYRANPPDAGLAANAIWKTYLRMSDDLDRAKEEMIREGMAFVFVVEPYTRK